LEKILLTKPVAMAATMLMASGLSFVAIDSVTAGPAGAATVVPHAVNGKVVKKRLVAAINGLPKAPETRAGYARDKFKLWDDADHDGQDTRSEVLRQESLGKVTGATTVKTGRWRSYYDNQTFTQASKLDIDHMVPLAEAWQSGGKGWSAGKREAYANDLTDARTLVAVSAHANRSKGDRQPGEWMPTYGSSKYLQQWVAVKLRWGLKADAAEKAALTSLVRSDRCGNPVIKVRLAVVKGAASSSAVSKAGGSRAGGGAGLDRRYPTATEAKAHGLGPYYRGVDPEYAWYRDGDSDGIVCE
jgi:hypothetical protein